MEFVVCPVLHNKDPVKPVAVNTELPQLLLTDIPGAVGIAIGAAVSLANELVQPFTVCETLYEPDVVVVMKLAVSPVLHKIDPPTPVAVNSELPQLLITDIPGADGIGVGAAVPLAAGLEQPSTVWVTVYVPAVVTVIELVVSPVLHNIDPVAPVAVSTELPQLFVTSTAGASTVEIKGAAVSLPSALVHPLIVCVTV